MVRADEAMDEDFDLTHPVSFQRALQARVTRPFIFGPVAFEGLDLAADDTPFDPEAERARVAAALERSPCLPDKLCTLGFKILIKKRNLKRRSSLLKHARFLRNLEALPILPDLPEPAGDGDDDAGSEGE
jgi:hypothetical protein